ncbi:MAG: DUF996 domain-containing protein [Candidatus Bathyarchaeota archaeon]|nr:DUF996 domain-containing protein [Candidatus Bathyarchaeota archaeon]
MNYETNKILGGIGAILMFIGILPVANFYGILELIGAVLILAALYGLSGHFHESGIFKNAVIGVLAGVVGAVLAFVILVAVVLANISSFLYQLYPGWDGSWASLSGMTADTSQFTSGNFDYSTLVPLVTGALAVLVILWVFAIVGTFFIRRSLKQVSAKSGVGLFGTAGTLLLAGAFLTIIGFGLLLMWIAALLLAIAFFQLKQAEPIAPPTYPPPPQPPT